jgi:hypothetical protein
LVSNTVVTMSRNDSVHSDARSTWSYRSEYSGSSSGEIFASSPAVLDRVDHLAHRQHYPPQLDEILAQPERLALQATPRVVFAKRSSSRALDGLRSSDCTASKWPSTM